MSMQPPGRTFPTPCPSLAATYWVYICHDTLLRSPFVHKVLIACVCPTLILTAACLLLHLSLYGSHKTSTGHVLGTMQEPSSRGRLYERIRRLQREDLGLAASPAHAQHGGTRLRNPVSGLVQVQRLRHCHRLRGQEHQALGCARPRQRAHIPPGPHVRPHPSSVSAVWIA